MNLSLDQLIKQLQAEINPNLRHQETNVVEIERNCRGLKLVTDTERDHESELHELRSELRRISG